MAFIGNRNEKKRRVKMNKPLYIGMSLLDISKILMYEFWLILYQSMETMQNYAIQILIALLFILKLKIFQKIFLVILKNGLIRLTMIKVIKELFQQEKIKKYLALDEQEEKQLQKLLHLDLKHMHIQMMMVTTIKKLKAQKSVIKTKTYVSKSQRLFV